MKKILCRIWPASLLVLIPLLVSAGDASSLIDASKNRDMDRIDKLLDDKVDVNQTLADGTTALHWAAHWDETGIADRLLKAGADPNLANVYGIVPLALACTNKSVVMTRRLLQAGANPNATSSTGETVLMSCSRTGTTDAVAALIDAGADVNTVEPVSGQTALMWAAAGGHGAITGLLIKHGADISKGTLPSTDRVPNTCRICEWKPSPGGFTALMYAARSGDIETARHILDAGADVNEATAEHGTPLVIASAGGHEDLALFLLSRGADPKAVDENGVTALHHAIQNGLASLYGITYDPVYRVRPDNMPRLARALLETGTDPNVRIAKSFYIGPAIRDACESVSDMVGATPFMLAAISADVSLLRLLEVYEADPEIGTSDGTTPLMVAARASCIGSNQQHNLANAKLESSLDAVKAIVEMGVDINTTNKNGDTAIHLAAFSGADPVVQFLADRGAQIDARNKRGETPWSMASGISPSLQDRGEYGLHESTAALLLKLGATPISRADMQVPDAYANFFEKEISIDPDQGTSGTAD